MLVQLPVDNRPKNILFMGRCIDHKHAVQDPVIRVLDAFNE